MTSGLLRHRHRRRPRSSLAPFLVLGALLVGGLTVAVGGSVAVGPLLGVVALLVLGEWAFGPRIVQWAIPAREIPHDDDGYMTHDPIGAIVARRCRDAGVPLVRLGVVDDGVPNAFAFGRTRRSARVWVTRGLLERLDEHELDAVVAHELGHVRNRDFVLMTIAAVVPLLLYALARALIDADDDDGDDEGDGVLLGLAVFVCYLVCEFVVLWLSRTREFAADHWSCECTGNGDALVSALVKIGYGMTVDSARAEKSDEVEAHSRRGAGLMRTMGIFDRSTAGSMVNGFVGGLDVERAVAALRWEATNPWAAVFEKLSTHPLVGRRIAALEQSGLAGRPTWLGLPAARLGTDSTETRRVRAQFAGRPHRRRVAVADIVHGADPAVRLRADAVAGRSAARRLRSVVRARARAPVPVRLRAGRRGDQPPRADGREPGARDPRRGARTHRGPGDAGVRLVVRPGARGRLRDRRARLRAARPIRRTRCSGSSEPRQFVDCDVVARGWYRRAPNPVIELRELCAADGRRARPYLWLARFVTAGALVVAGLAVTAVHLATSGG